jgi:hypothetical protein
MVYKRKTKKKTKKKSGKNKGGRPLFDGKDEKVVIGKLEEAFAYGCTDAEACFYADISKTALYDYQNNNSKFLERKGYLKENPIFLARSSVVKALQSDPNLALKFLERKKKKEFGPGVTIGGDEANPILFKVEEAKDDE